MEWQSIYWTHTYTVYINIDIIACRIQYTVFIFILPLPQYDKICGWPHKNTVVHMVFTVLTSIL